MHALKIRNVRSKPQKTEGSQNISYQKQRVMKHLEEIQLFVHFILKIHIRRKIKPQIVRHEFLYFF